MNRTAVGVDHQFSIGPLGIFVSADQKLQGELIEDVIVGGLGVRELELGQPALPDS